MDYKDKLKLALGGDKIRDDYEHLIMFSKDSSDHPGVIPSLVIRPESTEDVVKTVEILYSEKIPLTPRGMGTSLSGGSIPVKGGVVLAFDRMNRIKDVDTENLTITVEPGVITGDIIREAERFNLFYPPDPASLESCTIGGNVAENAGGPKAFKYGTTKHYVLELEVVIKNGERIRVGKRTKKWVVGYDLPMLFTGSEGTLGIITEITLRLIPKPPKVYTLLAAFPDEVKAGEAVSEIIKSSLFPTAIELVDNKCIKAVGEKIAPFLPKDTGAFLLVEFDGFGPEFEGQVERAYEIFEKRGVIDVFVAEDSSTRAKLWDARRKVLPSLESFGKLIRHEDVVVPRSKIADLVSYTERVERETGLMITNFGHAADGNIHVNILYENGQEDLMEKAVNMVIEKVWELGGTAAGEHGIGLLKKKHLLKEQGEHLLVLQKAIKGVFDPENLFNPDKMFV
ncbi:MAG: FAD-linked oxidase C-terminal domain-containing protein [candidate division WOR-3 bacterium]